MNSSNMNEGKKQFIDLAPPSQKSAPPTRPAEAAEAPLVKTEVKAVGVTTPAAKKSGNSWLDIVLWVIVVLLLLGIYPLYLYLTH